MINIFDTCKKHTANKKRNKKRSKSHSINLSQIGKEKLSKINPMAFAIFAIKSQENPNNEFIASSLKVISETPHLLTDKWILSINKFVESVSKAILLDPPEMSLGERVSLEGLTVYKVVPPKMDSEYPMSALICTDDRGWKFYFKTSKATQYSSGDTISLTATVSSHKEGITFMRRPSMIKKLS